METKHAHTHEKESKAQKTSLHHLHDVYQSAIRSLEFYKEELQYLQKRLADIIAANTKQEVLGLAEHFQNEFIISADNIGELKARISKSLQHTEALIVQKPEHIDEKSVADLGIYSRDLHVIEKSFAGMKHEFNIFLAKYL